VCCEAASVPSEAMHLPERARNLTELQCPRALFPGALERPPGTDHPWPESQPAGVIRQHKTIRLRSMGRAIKGGRIAAAGEPDGILCRSQDTAFAS